MAFADLDPLPPAVVRLQRSLERGRLGHAYLLSGPELEPLETVARTLAKTLNCLTPPRRAPNGQPLDCCDTCARCRKIDRDLYPDVHWVRPESKLRVILIDQIRQLLEAIYLKAGEAPRKVAILVAADRMNEQAANAFLKTLEEPPDGCVLLLLTTEPARVLETLRSRCLHLVFGAGTAPVRDPALSTWLRGFSERVAASPGSLLARYHLLDQILAALAARREAVQQELQGRSPLQRYEDLEPALREQWENELKAAVEAGYRRQRGELLAAIHTWLRDVWLTAQGLGEGRLHLPELAAATAAVAGRIAPPAAEENLRVLEHTERLLAGTNVQEALALEVCLLRLQL